MKNYFVPVIAGVVLISSGVASAQTATTTPTGPALGVILSATPVVRPGTGDAILALAILSAERSNAAIQTQSLPVTFAFGGGLTAASLSDCRVRNVNSLSSSLGQASVSPAAGLNTFTYDSALSIESGRIATLALTCDVAADAPSGGTIQLSLTPANVPATVVGSSTSVTPTTGFTASGNVGPTSGSVLVSSASSGGSSGPLIPGAPNTGLGSDTNNLMAIAASAMVILFGAMLLRRRA